MPYELVVTVDSVDAAEVLRRLGREDTRLGYPYLAPRPQPVVEVLPANAYWKRPYTREVGYGRVFKRTDKGIIVQDGDATEYITPATGTDLSGLSRQEALAFGNNNWWRNFSLAERDRMRRREQV